LRELYFPPSCQPDKFIEGLLSFLFFYSLQYLNKWSFTGRAVKGRNEPCAVGGVAWVVASLKNCELIDVSRAAWNNTVEMYDLHELMDEEYHNDIKTRDAPKDDPVENGGTVESGAMEVKEVDPKEKKLRTLKKKAS
jgi:hypothetical protein